MFLFESDQSVLTQFVFGIGLLKRINERYSLFFDIEKGFSYNDTYHPLMLTFGFHFFRVPGYSYRFKSKKLKRIKRGILWFKL